MESFGMERRVQQGEDWNLDVEITADEYGQVPYIITNNRINPFFVITVASTKFEKNLRYVKSWWNKVDDSIPRFYSTNPISYGELHDVDIDGTLLVADYHDLLPDEPSTTDTDPTYGDEAHPCLYQYTVESEAEDPRYGHKPYHYFYFKYGTTTSRIDEYYCFIRQNFLSKETAEWASQNYLYQITLVDGELMYNSLNAIYAAHFNELDPKSLADWPKDAQGNVETTEDTDFEVVEARYNYIKTRWPNEFQPDIEASSPLGRIEVPVPILRPTKLEVFNNLRTLI